jgi:hypothetical protein
MSTTWVKLEEVIKFLWEDGNLKFTTDGKPLLIKSPHRKPTHGNCCTCQTCGYHYDYCVCDHNNTIDWINKLEKFDGDI